MDLAQLPIGDKAPDVVNVIIEIPAGSKNKYEFDEEFGVIKLDRVGYAAMAHPYDYGFIPGTRSEDGDHLDAFVILDHSVFPGCVVAARPVGMVKMVDDGEGDEKIICVPAKDVRYDHVTELDQLTPHLPKEIQHFFEHYKDLQNKKTEITGWENAEAAKAMIKAAQEAEAKRA
jgi:inorganic pyrophosphatase